MKRLQTITLLLAVVLPEVSIAGPYEEIISRCRSQMGEYGSAMVKACVDQDIKAADLLTRYPLEAKSLIARCHSQMGEYGWAITKACVDQDMEAERELREYQK